MRRAAIKAYKFLRAGAIGPFSGFAWPAPADGGPGAWVRAGDHPDPCRRGVHACRVEHLPWWIADELWEVELAGKVVACPHKVAAGRGRLVRRVEGWTAALGRQYAAACALHARDHAVAALWDAGRGAEAQRLAACAALEAVETTARALAGAVPEARIALTMAADGALTAREGAAATSAYVAAHAAGRRGGSAAAASERLRQAEWLRRWLGLDPAR